ncbi:hypothetical protein F5Y10DRAFT_269980 [Nemania abortiva]|nr:hypothetical protein F5Y10DRAFT_269980 [Nemania abortiva]
MANSFSSSVSPEQPTLPSSSLPSSSGGSNIATPTLSPTLQHNPTLAISSCPRTDDDQISRLSNETGALNLNSNSDTVSPQSEGPILPRERPDNTRYHRLDLTRYEVKYRIPEGADIKRLKKADLPSYWARSEDFRDVAASKMVGRNLLIVYTNDLATWGHLTFNGGAAVGNLLNCKIEMFLDKHAFRISEFCPKIEYDRKLDPTALNQANSVNGCRSIMKIWKTNGFWVVSTRDRPDAYNLVGRKWIILNGTTYKVRPFDLRGLMVYCFTCCGPHMQSECPTPTQYRCGRCAVRYATAGDHDQKTCENEPRCIHCSEGHSHWKCTSDKCPEDVKRARDKARHFRKQNPRWYEEYRELTGPRLSHVPAPSKKAGGKRTGQRQESKFVGESKSKTVQMNIVFMFRNQKASRTSTPPTASMARTEPSPSPLPSSAPSSAPLQETDVAATTATATTAAAAAAAVHNATACLQGADVAAATSTALSTPRTDAVRGATPIPPETGSVNVAACQGVREPSPSPCVASTSSPTSVGDTADPSSIAPPSADSVTKRTRVLEPETAPVDPGSSQPSAKRRNTGAQSLSTEVVTKKRRGRPPGSKNKPKRPATAAKPAAPSSTPSTPLTVTAQARLTVAELVATHSNNPFGIDLSRNLEQ